MTKTSHTGTDGQEPPKRARVNYSPLQRIERSKAKADEVEKAVKAKLDKKIVGVGKQVGELIKEIETVGGPDQRAAMMGIADVISAEFKTVPEPAP